MASAAYSMDVSGHHQRSMWGGGGWGEREPRLTRQITRQDTQVGIVIVTETDIIYI